MLCINRRGSKRGFGVDDTTSIVSEVSSIFPVLVRILIEHLGSKDGTDSKLHFDSMCSIRTVAELGVIQYCIKIIFR